MIAVDAWPLLLVGVTFTALACFKLYGLRRGIVGGVNKSRWEHLCGT